MNNINGNNKKDLNLFDDIVQSDVRWFCINKSCMPEPDCGDFSDGRYSKPVLIANAYTGQVESHTVVYDFRDDGWCLYGLPDGSDCRNYELLYPTHFCYLPQLNLKNRS